MKKVFLLNCFLFLFIGLKAQTNDETNKWFLSFSTGFSVGGPSASINSTMEDRYYNVSADSWFGPVKYPVASHTPPLIFMLGKRVTKYGSLYLVVGQPAAGSVDGYNGVSFLNIDYHILQFTLGYQFSFPNTRFKAGLGPSVFIFKNSSQEQSQSVNASSSTIPGATITIRAPFGKEKKLFGVELFFQMNLAPAATIGEIQMDGHSFPSSSVSMTYAVIGVTFAFRG